MRDMAIWMQMYLDTGLFGQGRVVRCRTHNGGGILGDNLPHDLKFVEVLVAAVFGR